ncbi:MAG TPA: hypothetical protein VN894_01765 [Polyangiaceae bacterium]|nr:hypothetical protein [Polyangiaceae bacterium]
MTLTDRSFEDLARARKVRAICGAIIRCAALVAPKTTAREMIAQVRTWNDTEWEAIESFAHTKKASETTREAVMAALEDLVCRP